MKEFVLRTFVYSRTNSISVVFQFCSVFEFLVQTFYEKMEGGDLSSLKEIVYIQYSVFIGTSVFLLRG